MKPTSSPGAAIVPAPARETIEWLLRVEDFTTARSLIRTIERHGPKNDPAMSDYVASVLFRAKDYKHAAATALRTLELLPSSVEARFNAAKCLNSAGQPAAAEWHMRAVTEARPEWVDPSIDLATYVAAQGRLDEAMGMLLQIATRLPPGDKHADVVEFNLGWHHLRHGDFKKGMSKLGIGRRLRIWGSMAHRHSRPMLAPDTDLRGKTILLCGEGGAGDEMINARFGQIITARGGRAIWSAQPALRTLLARTPGIAAVVTPADIERCEFDYWAPCMDLPRLLQLDVSDLPNEPYIVADPAHVEKWRSRIGKGSQLKVGIRWQGNALYEQDLMRSVPFALLERLTTVQGVELYSLQRDEGADERPSGSPVIDLGPDLATWEDTAGAIANLDLVISSCTSVPHLAAAMGKPTWIFCPINCYYVWATPGERSPWYKSVRLFRQLSFGAWDEAARMIGDELRRVVEAGMVA